MNKPEARIQKRESRIQNPERGQGAGMGGNRWWIAAVLLVAGGCATPKTAQFTDADWVSHSTTGRGAYERGDYRRAADAYGRAQQRARALDNADALAVAAANGAVCLLAESRAGDALAAVEEALADARVSTERRAELLAMGARACVALDRPDAAIERSVGALALNPCQETRAQVLLAQSAALLKKGETDSAAQALGDGLSAKEWARQPTAIRAEREQRRGQIMAATGESSAAAKRFDEAAELWREAGRLPEMARALAEAGRQAKALGDMRGAGDRFWRAARSLWAQGRGDEAARVLEEGVACAAEAGDEDLGGRMAALVVTFGNGMRLTK